MPRRRMRTEANVEGRGETLVESVLTPAKHCRQGLVPCLSSVCLCICTHRRVCVCEHACKKSAKGIALVLMYSPETIHPFFITQFFISQHGHVWPAPQRGQRGQHTVPGCGMEHTLCHIRCLAFPFNQRYDECVSFLSLSLFSLEDGSAVLNEGLCARAASRLLCASTEPKPS